MSADSGRADGVIEPDPSYMGGGVKQPAEVREDGIIVQPDPDWSGGGVKQSDVTQPGAEQPDAERPDPEVTGG